MGAKSSDKEANGKVVETAKLRFDIAVSADAENRKEALKDMRFRAGNQWPDEIKTQREAESRPCLTINKIPQNVHQITNEQRQSRPSVSVHPVDDNADIETAEVLQGIVRHIEYNSSADTAYDSAVDSSVTGGRGFFRVITDYCNPMSFDQEILIKAIKDPHTVLLDPSYKESDGSDANWGFIFEDIPKEEFEKMYPSAEASENEWTGLSGDWVSDDSIRIAEYFTKEFKKTKIYQLEDGSVVTEKELNDFEFLDETQKDNLKSREAMIPSIVWYKLNGHEVLEKTEWLGSWVPIIPIHGEELIVDGKRVFEGIIRHARDPQAMYNFWATCETETIALAPKAPFIGVEGQFEGHEDVWANINKSSTPYAEYRRVDIEGKPAPAPQRSFGEAPVQAITQARMLASDDIKSTTGIYNASLGNSSNETSGIAIRNRTSQAQTGNYHFTDNLTRSIRHLGRILVELIPKIYDTERAITIIGADDEREIVTINGMFEEDGEEKEYDLSKGKYDVTATAGPSYSSKRQEASESMLQMTQHYPKLAEVGGDLMVKAMDFPGSDELATRIRKTIPPEILGDNKEQQEIPPEIQQQLEQMGAQIEQMGGELDQANSALENKTMELESKERIEFAKLENNTEIERAKLEAEYNEPMQAIQFLSSEINDIKNLFASFQDPSIEQEEEFIPEIPEEDTELEEALLSDSEFNNLTGEIPPEAMGQEPIEEFLNE